MTRIAAAPAPTLAKSALPPLLNARAEDAREVTALIDRSFGPGRFAKTAERLREGASPLMDLSFTARAGGELVGERARRARACRGTA